MCTLFDLDPVCVYLLHINMGLTLSVLRARLYFYYLIARNMPSNGIMSLREHFCELPGSMLGVNHALNSTFNFRFAYKLQRKTHGTALPLHDSKLELEWI